MSRLVAVLLGLAALFLGLQVQPEAASAKAAQVAAYVYDGPQAAAERLRSDYDNGLVLVVDGERPYDAGDAEPFDASTRDVSPGAGAIRTYNTFASLVEHAGAISPTRVAGVASAGAVAGRTELIRHRFFRPDY